MKIWKPPKAIFYYVAFFKKKEKAEAKKVADLKKAADAKKKMDLKNGVNPKKKSPNSDTTSVVIDSTNQ